MARVWMYLLRWMTYRLCPKLGRRRDPYYLEERTTSLFPAVRSWETNILIMSLRFINSCSTETLPHRIYSTEVVSSYARGMSYLHYWFYPQSSFLQHIAEVRPVAQGIPAARNWHQGSCEFPPDSRHRHLCPRTTHHRSDWRCSSKDTEEPPTCFQDCLDHA